MDSKIKGPAAASINTAPPEILLQIAKSVPDLRSLHHLALALPSIYRLWISHGSEILREVTSNRSVTTPQVRDLILLVALLRSGEMPVWSFDTFLERFVRPTLVLNSAPESPCSIPTPTSCPLSVLGTAGRMYHLTHSCLEYYLERLREVQPRLQRPVDQGFDYEAPYGPHEMMVPGWLREVEGIFYETPCMEPPSWIEEQVVFRAFWRLQLLYDFRQAGKQSRLDGWSESDVSRIANLQLDELFPCAHPHMTTYHEIVSVQEYLDESSGGDLPPQEEASKEDVGLAEIPDDAWSWVLRSGTVRHLQYSPNGLLNRGPVHLALHGLISRDESPINGVSFSVFRRLGFALWDNQRLATLQLADEPLYVGQETTLRKRPSQFWFSWRSILSEEELAVVVNRLSDAEDEVTRQGRLDLERHGLDYFVRNE
ncbi:hypothetical protein IFR04_003870 [Cadophora malorum]|uniref:F-box domain-containing protein n=1 Tax=Cadophora malorum TaxID=108018 RepID=A0A8H7WDW5_9HELO|nr:hypothetical protein IFR04_003870 [Cadophora malorum]